jgi:phosphotransferase system  glucose/maltose/N-acetylglucosamine-specific IIC component
VPVWPFVTLSFALGVFAIFPYLIFWDLQNDSVKCPPDSEELTTGWGKYAMQALESQVLPGVLLAATIGLLFNAFTSGPASWDAYLRLFDESKFVHITSLDFCALSALAPLFLWNDAQRRGAEWAVPLAAVPMIGPLIYLILRPRATKA